MNERDPLAALLGRPAAVDRYVTVPDRNHGEMADETHDRLRRQIADFEADLEDTEEIGACLAHFGREVTIRIEHIGYHNPGLIIFYGRALDGNDVRLVQHLSQVNLLLIRVPAANPEAPHRIVTNDEDQGDETDAEDRADG